jgi:hypothetical protein
MLGDEYKSWNSLLCNSLLEAAHCFEALWIQRGNIGNCEQQFCELIWRLVPAIAARSATNFLFTAGVRSRFHYRSRLCKSIPERASNSNRRSHCLCVTAGDCVLVCPSHNNNCINIMVHCMIMRCSSLGQDLWRLSSKRTLYTSNDIECDEDLI